MGVAGYIGASELLQNEQAIFVGFIAFSIVCLLFLVVMELLSEAREVAGENLPVNAMFLIGLLAGILLDHFLEDQ